MKTTNVKSSSDLVLEINEKIINQIEHNHNELKRLKLEQEFKLRTNKLRQNYLIKNLNEKLDFKNDNIKEEHEKALEKYYLKTDKEYFTKDLKTKTNLKFKKEINKVLYSYKSKNIEKDQSFEDKKVNLKKKLLNDYKMEVSNFKEANLTKPELSTDKITTNNEKTSIKISNTKIRYEKKYAKLVSSYLIKIEKIKSSQKESLDKLYSERDKIIDENNLSIEKKIYSYEELTEKLNKETILKVSNLTMKFGGLTAVNDLSFEIKKGEIFGLIGPNGAGKTTVFNCITKFYDPTEGEILFRRDSNSPIINITNEKVHNVINKGIARTFQNVEVVYELTVLENLMIGSHSRFNANIIDVIFRTSRLRYEEGVVYNKAIEILEKFELLEYINFYPSALPYGVLKKLEFARSLMSEPSLIILDEPAAGLNEIETKELSKLILDIRDNFNVTILLVEHDMGLVMSISDRICAINFGKELITGTPTEVQNNSDVKIAYLGGDY